MIIRKDHLVDEGLAHERQYKVFHLADVPEGMHVGLSDLALDLERWQESCPDWFALVAGERPRLVAVLEPVWA